jgi:hypothetical protein
MITINTIDFVTMAWISMGIWAAVTLIQEVKYTWQHWSDENMYWKKKHDALREELNSRVEKIGS